MRIGIVGQNPEILKAAEELNYTILPENTVEDLMKVGPDLLVLSPESIDLHKAVLDQVTAANYTGTVLLDAPAGHLKNYDGQVANILVNYPLVLRTEEFVARLNYGVKLPEGTFFEHQTLITDLGPYALALILREAIHNVKEITFKVDSFLNDFLTTTIDVGPNHRVVCKLTFSEDSITVNGQRLEPVKLYETLLEEIRHSLNTHSNLPLITLREAMILNRMVEKWKDAYFSGQEVSYRRE